MSSGKRFTELPTCRRRLRKLSECLSKNRHSGSNALNFTQCGNYYENLTRLELLESCQMRPAAAIEAMH
ncbi:hypothetical protein ACO1KF_01205 [Leptospira interrogans serovar Hardjo-prajitno]|uniref:hypothetical protein n=1 Tax=Leptospira interrogans TaxID=173 RepID=UPI00031730C2|nr:hypothetical protein [Leptospira interrogans]UPO18204.1 hypothetical protein MY479_02890 [Leptospira interrogans]